MRSKLYCVVHALLAVLLRFLNNVHVKGKKNEPTLKEGPYIIASNHLSWTDPVWLCASTKHQQPHFMAKKELFSTPAGPLVKALGAYPVDRGGADVGAIRKTIKMLEDGYCIGMFPQGHRNPGVDQRGTRIHPGIAMIALKANVPVLPVYIKVKNNKPGWLKRKDVIIGKPIRPEEFGYDNEASGEYNRITGMIFERICSLGDEV